MNLPNLFIPGAGKSGTTSLHQYLAQHPQIFMTKEIKEPHFFSHDANYSRGLEFYTNFFEGSEKYLIRGESSTGYLVFPKVVERIRKTISHPKFLIILRNPVDRAYSHYWWLKGMGFENNSFQVAFLTDIDEEPDPNQHTNSFYKYYFQFGLYGKWLKRYIIGFGKEKILVITSNELKNDLSNTLSKCFRFLGVNDFENIETIQANPTVILKNPRIYQTFINFQIRPNWLSHLIKLILPEEKSDKLKKRIRARLKKVLRESDGYPPLTEEDRIWIANFYRDDVALLRQTTGMNFSVWQKDFPIK